MVDEHTRHTAREGAMGAVVTGPNAIPASPECGKILLEMVQQASAGTMREIKKPQMSDKQSAPKLVTIGREEASPDKAIGGAEKGLLCEENTKPTEPEDISLWW